MIHEALVQWATHAELSINAVLMVYCYTNAAHLLHNQPTTGHPDVVSFFMDSMSAANNPYWNPDTVVRGGGGINTQTVVYNGYMC